VFVFTLDDERGVRAFAPPGDDAARPWRFIELPPVPGVLVAVAVAVPAGEAQDPVLHPGYGFPRFPLPHPAGGHPAAPA
jgi:4'-phosphopantetheinyl transferase